LKRLEEEYDEKKRYNQKLKNELGRL